MQQAFRQVHEAAGDRAADGAHGGDGEDGAGRGDGRNEGADSNNAPSLEDAQRLLYRIKVIVQCCMIDPYIYVPSDASTYK